MPTPGPLELVIILVIALLILGPGKLPDVGAALGKSIKEFRKASSDIQESVKVETSPLPPAQVAPVAPAPAAPAPDVAPVVAAVPAVAAAAAPAVVAGETVAVPTPEPAVAPTAADLPGAPSVATVSATAVGDEPTPRSE